MKHSFLKSAFSLLAAAALLTACGNSATQSNADSSSDASSAPSESSSAENVQPDIGSELTIGVKSFTAHAGDKAVPVSVEIWNNPGYAATGIQLFYDPMLKPVITDETSEATTFPFAKCDLGDAAEGFLKSCLVGEEDHIIAFGGMSTENSTKDGVMFTVYFDIPDDVPAGQEFSFVCVMDSLNTMNQERLSPKTLDGKLTIE